MKDASIVFAGAMLLIATTARAQDIPEPTPPAERRLATDPASAIERGPWNFLFSTFNGYDQVGFNEAAGAPAGAAADILQQSTQRGGLSARFDTTRKRADSTLSFSGGATSEYYAAARRVLTDGNAFASQSTKMGRRTSITATENFSYAPYYSLTLFPGFGTVPGTNLATPYEPTFDLGVSTSPVYRYGISGEFSTGLTNRTDLIADYQGLRTLAESRGNLAYQEVGARLLHRTSESFGYHLGYAFAESAHQELHHFRIGIDGRKSLSRSRRTVIGFGTDSTLVKRPPGSLAAHTEFRLLGNAVLDQYIGRTWSARLSYRRDVQMVDGYAAPVFREFVSSGLWGTFNHRTSAGVNGSYVLADMPGETVHRRDSGITGSVWLQVAIARTMTAFGQVTYYQHRIKAQASELHLPPQFFRNSVRAGLLLTLPPAAMTRVPE